MAVHTLGSTSVSTNGHNSTTAYDEIIPTSSVSMPSNGYVTNLVAHFGPSGGGTIFGQLLLFDGSYNLLVGGTAGGQNFSGVDWHSQATGPAFYASGATLRVGWWVSSGSSLYFYVGASGGWRGGSVSLPSSGGSFGTPGSPYFQAYPNWYLEWIDPLSVSGASGSGSAHAGDTIDITGLGFTGGTVTNVTFNGIAATSWGIDSDTQIHAVVPSGNTTGTLEVFSDHGDGTISWTLGAPTISSLSPSTANAGASVVITGDYFTDGSVSSVTFNGLNASSYTVNSNTQITATVPSGYTSGSLVVNTNHGSASYAFTEGPPIISGVSPTTAGVGQTVTITGNYYTDGTVSSVTFTGISASFTVNSDTQITATVPSGATTGNITVNTNHGSASWSFTVSGIHVYDGSAWQNATLYVYDGSAWQLCTLYAYDGTTWQQAQ